MNVESLSKVIGVLGKSFLEKVFGLVEILANAEVIRFPSFSPPIETLALLVDPFYVHGQVPDRPLCFLGLLHDLVDSSIAVVFNLNQVLAQDGELLIVQNTVNFLLRIHDLRLALSDHTPVRMQLGFEFPVPLNVGLEHACHL